MSVDSIYNKCMVMQKRCRVSQSTVHYLTSLTCTCTCTSPCKHTHKVFLKEKFVIEVFIKNSTCVQMLSAHMEDILGKWMDRSSWMRSTAQEGRQAFWSVSVSVLEHMTVGTFKMSE